MQFQRALRCLCASLFVVMACQASSQMGEADRGGGDGGNGDTEPMGGAGGSDIQDAASEPGGNGEGVAGAGGLGGDAASGGVQATPDAGVGGQVTLPEGKGFCDPKNFRPFAKDGTLDAVADKVSPGGDYARTPNANIPKGQLTNVAFDGGSVAVYVPAAYENAKAGDVALMVFLSRDGANYRGSLTHLIIDNLIAAGEIPVMLVAFLAVPNKVEMENNPVGSGWIQNLETKVFPAITAKYNKVSAEARMHGMAGGSSWGLGAFHVAWFKPDFVGKVLAHSGSFVCFGVLKNYPNAISAAAVKPIRIAMTVGHCDIVGSVCTKECTDSKMCFLDSSNCGATWSDVNIAVGRALSNKGYAYRLIRGAGGHNMGFWMSMLSDDLRWLWRPEVCK